MVDMDVVGVQILQPREDATYALHLQILSNEADKAAFPPLEEEAGAVVV